MTFKHYCDLYLEFKRHELKYSTFYKYENIVKSRLSNFFEIDIRDIKPSDIKKWLYSIDDVGSKSKRHYLGVLSGIFQEALYDEIISRNPVKLVRMPKVQKPHIQPFTPDQVLSLLNLAENENYRYFLSIAFFTGMRSGEIIALKKEDIDLEKKIIYVKRSRSRYGETTPKTRYSVREVPILNTLYPYLEKLLHKHDHEYLLINQYKMPYRDSHVFVDKFWKPSLSKLKLQYRRLYNTRHTFATNMLYKNLVSPVQLAQILGHANTQMVYDVYVSYVNQKYDDFDRSIDLYGA